MTEKAGNRLSLRPTLPRSVSRGVQRSERLGNYSVDRPASDPLSLMAISPYRPTYFTGQRGREHVQRAQWHCRRGTGTEERVAVLLMIAGLARLVFLAPSDIRVPTVAA